MSPREHRASLRRDLQEGSYCAQFKTYHEEMKEDPSNIEPVTEAELARVAELYARLRMNPMTLEDCQHNLPIMGELSDLCPRIARELAAARAAIKAANRLLDDRYLPWHNAGGVNDCAHGYGEGIPCPKCDRETVRAALNTHAHEKTKP